MGAVKGVRGKLELLEKHQFQRHQRVHGRVP
jgi:hypothetical protein